MDFGTLRWIRDTLKILLNAKWKNEKWSAKFPMEGFCFLTIASFIAVIQTPQMGSDGRWTYGGRYYCLSHEALMITLLFLLFFIHV
jgi:hypothetical protein